MTDVIWFVAGVVVGQVTLVLALWLVRGAGRERDRGWPDEHASGV